MNIRHAQTKDQAAVTSLWAATGLTRPWNDPAYDFNQSLSCGSSTVFVCEDQSGIIGSVMAGYEGHRGWIYYLSVRADQQKCGIGSALLAHAEHWLKIEQKTPKCHLLIRKDNEAIQNYYASNGYERSDVLVMQKWLNQ